MLIKYWPDRTKIPFMSFRIAGALFSMILIAGSAFLLGTQFSQRQWRNLLAWLAVSILPIALFFVIQLTMVWARRNT